MRIATITNWAYGATVCLTLASGIVMLMASNADNVERQAVKQRQVFDRLTEEIETNTWMLSDLACLFVIKKEPFIREEYRQKESELKSIEHHLVQLKDNGASGEELMLLQDGLKIIEELQDEQQTALDSIARGEQQQAVALLFLFVMGVILKRHVLHPVVRLSDVVHRLASQDYAVETPNFTQIDEIGDMAQAIRIFRENGLVLQQLEKERDADWAIRELLARMTQRLQGCENLADVINVAELFAPNIAPGVSGRLYIFDREPWQMRCAAEW